MTTKQGFKITEGKGFHITFENGWTVSVQFGANNYCDHYNAPLGADSRILAEKGSPDAEIAAWSPDGSWYRPDEWDDDVSGYNSPAAALALLNEIASKKP